MNEQVKGTIFERDVTDILFNTPEKLSLIEANRIIKAAQEERYRRNGPFCEHGNCIAYPSRRKMWKAPFND